MRILLDMDEVLSDFQAGAAAAWGLDPRLYPQLLSREEWHMGNRLSELMCLNHYMTEEEFWEPIYRRYGGFPVEFWLSLEPTPWARELVQQVSQLTDDWWVITTPTRCTASYVGKIGWLRNHFGTDFDRFVPTPHKQLFSRWDTILVDDNPDNIRAFINDPGKGSGILFPRAHNANRCYVGSEVAYTVHTIMDIANGGPS